MPGTHRACEALLKTTLVLGERVEERTKPFPDLVRLVNVFATKFQIQNAVFRAGVLGESAIRILVGDLVAGKNQRPLGRTSHK